MLLIGQPKSASTSLMVTLAAMAKVGYKNGHNRTKNDIKCSGFEETQKYHGTTVERSFNYLKKYVYNRQLIYKEHILPTNIHMAHLRELDGKYIVSLREPKEILASYKRVFNVLPEVKVDFKKLLKEIESFYYIYSELKDDRFKVVYYKDLILNFKDTMIDLLKFWNYDIPKNIDKFRLARRNFTGHGLKKYDK